MLLAGNHTWVYLSILYILLVCPSASFAPIPNLWSFITRIFMFDIWYVAIYYHMSCWTWTQQAGRWISEEPYLELKSSLTDPFCSDPTRFNTNRNHGIRVEPPFPHRRADELHERFKLCKFPAILWWLLGSNARAWRSDGFWLYDAYAYIYIYWVLPPHPLTVSQ